MDDEEIKVVQEGPMYTHFCLGAHTAARNVRGACMLDFMSKAK